MLNRRTREPERIWLATLGVIVGFATGLALWRARRVLRALPIPGLPVRMALGAMEDAIVDVLLDDPDLCHRPIEVGAIADGIVELTGEVATDEEAHRAVSLARQVPGVRTVLNRLDSEALVTHLDETRRRLAAGDPSLTETWWHGQSVGTGRRRQRRPTEPDRPDDKVDIVSRELGADRAVELTSERLDKIPSGVQGHTTRPPAPVDRGRVDDASHRRLGNVPAESPQEVNPESGVLRELKKGERITLEEIGRVEAGED